MTERIAELIQREQGVFLDIGCGPLKEKRAIGMDIRQYPGDVVDIIHDIRVLPWPIPDAVCYRVLASHILEHVPPNEIFGILAEVHRVLKDHGQLLIAMPYGMSPRTLQDPSHYRGWIESTPKYWDCDDQLWNIYQLPCFKIELNQWNAAGDLNIVMAKRAPDDHGRYHHPEPKD